MEMSVQLHVPAALPPGTNALERGGWVGPGAGLDAVERRTMSCPCRESNPDSSTVQSVVRRCADFTIMCIMEKSY
jgi:hypothetical protein